MPYWLQRAVLTVQNCVHSGGHTSKNRDRASCVAEDKSRRRRRSSAVYHKVRLRSQAEAARAQRIVKCSSACGVCLADTIFRAAVVVVVLSSASPSHTMHGGLDVCNHQMVLASHGGEAHPSESATMALSFRSATRDVLTAVQYSVPFRSSGLRVQPGEADKELSPPRGCCRVHFSSRTTAFAVGK